MSSLFGIAMPQPYLYLLVLVGIIVSLALFGVILRRVVRTSQGIDANRGRQPRLGVVDSFEIDRQRQLLIIRRDAVEHLVLIGGASDLLIESNIVRATPSTQRETVLTSKVTIPAGQTPDPLAMPPQLAQTAPSLRAPRIIPQAPSSTGANETRMPEPKLPEAAKAERRSADFNDIARQLETRYAPPASPLQAAPVPQQPQPMPLESFTSAASPTTPPEAAALPEAHDPLSAPIIPLRDARHATEGLRRLLGRQNDPFV